MAFAPVKGEIPDRHNGVLISNENGDSVAYALFNLQERGRLFIGHGEKLYEGMIIGIHSRDNDLVVNPIKTKKLTNIRAAGKDEAILLTPPIELTLEYAVEFIADDELVEVTPDFDPHPQALPQGNRSQARLAQRRGADRLSAPRRIPSCGARAAPAHAGARGCFALDTYGSHNRAREPHDRTCASRLSVHGGRVEVHAEFPLQRDLLIACRTGGNHTATLPEGPSPAAYAPSG